jgi:polyisoprenoid-binding protein YceI
MLAVASLQAQTKWKVKDDAVEVKFRIKNFGVWVEGSFGGMIADIAFDAATPQAGTIKASVETGTINTGIESRDKHLKSEDYFDAATYPKITMQSTSIEKKGDQLQFTGKLTIKSTTKTLSFPFAFADLDGKGIFRAEFEIDRTAYGVGSSGGPMGETVKITLSVPVTRQ